MSKWLKCLERNIQRKKDKYLTKDLEIPAK
jgi:hypothetical protein